MICPAPPRSRLGNRVTALRWSRLLRALGHRVEIAGAYAGQPCDVMVALHAQRSHAALRDYRRRHPAAPLVVALTGTDLYRDLPGSAEAQESLRLASRLVALHDLAARALPAEVQGRLRVIHQSAVPLPARPTHPLRRFDLCVVAHLRGEKDPLRAAEAARLLPGSSRIRVLHAGGALDEAMGARAREEAATNPRYRWLGDLPHARVRRLMARSRALVLSSRMEGGANVISEAAAGGLPVLASEIPGTVGLLGEGYAGYFAVGDAAALARLMARIEAEPAFLAALAGQIGRVAPRFTPERERESWRRLLEELVPSGTARGR